MRALAPPLAASRATRSRALLRVSSQAWRMQWSVAMQENEELRSKLYETRNHLEAAGGGGGQSGEHWRELCISIAKSAEVRHLASRSFGKLLVSLLWLSL